MSLVSGETGFPCQCGARAYVVDTRRWRGSTRRRRECPVCQTRFNTIEIAEVRFAELADFATGVNRLILGLKHQLF